MDFIRLVMRVIVIKVIIFISLTDFFYLILETLRRNQFGDMILP